MADMSFLPEDYLEKKAQRRTSLISLSLFAVVMAAVVAAFFVTDRQRSDIKNQQKAVNAQFIEAAKRLEQLETLQQRKQQMIHKAQVTATLLERVPRSLILSELINGMPMTVALTELTLDTRTIRETRSLASSALDDAKRKAAAKSKKPETEIFSTEVLLRMSGTAPTDLEVAQLMSTLGQCPLFTDVNLTISEEASLEERTFRKFTIEAKVNQDTDLRKYEPKMVQRGQRNPLDGSAPDSTNKPDLPQTPSPTDQASGHRTAIVPENR